MMMAVAVMMTTTITSLTLCPPLTLPPRRGAAGRAPRGRHPGAGVEEQRAAEGVRPGELQGAGVRGGPGLAERDGPGGTLHAGAVPQPLHQAGGAGAGGGLVGVGRDRPASVLARPWGQISLQ